MTLTATLTESHSPYAVINLGGTGSLVPPLCDVPFLLMAGVDSVSFVRPTAVVSTPTDVNLHVLISYPDATIGRSRNLVSVPSTLTLNPGGTEPPASLASFTLAPSPIGPGQVSVMDVALSSALATGGISSTGTATLNMAAPPGGAGVFLSSSGVAASVPPSVIVPADRPAPASR